jgi:hypothetical protein
LSWEDELQALARDRESAYQSSLSLMMVDHRGMLRRQLRYYLLEQTIHGRLKKTCDVPRLDTHMGGLQELVCEEVEFRSDSRLSFIVEMEQEQTGWLVKRFKFHLHLARRSINMIRIHLNQEVGHDPLTVPRCHFHIGDSKAHIPFPIMSPRLMLHLICEHIEVDLGLPIAH